MDSLEKSSSIDSALFGTTNRVTLVENQDRATVSIQQQGTGTVTYHLEDKKVYWKRDGTKITNARIGCLHKTSIPHCLKNPFLNRTLWGEFSNTYELFFKQIQVIGRLLDVCEEINKISFLHPLYPECTELFTGKLSNINGVECNKHKRKCVPRCQEGTISAVTAIVPLGPEISRRSP